MIYAESFVPDLSLNEFTIERLIIYDPTLKPKAQKPLEQDFQDAKLLYYYPEDINIEIKRNDVGLAEGMVLFWGAYGEENSTRNQLVYTNQYAYILDNFEDTLWICVVLKNFTEETVYFPAEGKTYQSLPPENFRVEKPTLTRETAQRFAKHFVNSFHLFYGKVSKFMTEEQRLNEDFPLIFEKFMLYYKKLNCINFPRINMAKYLDTYLNYAPIDKKVFMAVHYLMDVIKNIDKNIKHQIVFFNGYFIYSTFPLKIAQMFYDYFFLNGDTTSIDVNKLLTKFATIQDKLKFDPRLKYGHRLELMGDKGYITGFIDNSETKSRIIEEAVEEDSVESIQDEFIPTVHLDTFGHDSTYRMITYFEGGLLMCSFYNSREDIHLNKLNEVESAVSTNIQKLKANLDKHIRRIYAQDEISKLLYENHCNFALRVSKTFLGHVDSNLFRTINFMKEKLDKDKTCRSIITKCHGYWVYGRVFNQRRVFMLLNGLSNLLKAEEEKEELIKYNFSNILY